MLIICKIYYYALVIQFIFDSLVTYSLLWIRLYTELHNACIRTVLSPLHTLSNVKFTVIYLTYGTQNERVALISCYSLLQTHMGNKHSGHNNSHKNSTDEPILSTEYVSFTSFTPEPDTTFANAKPGPQLTPTMRPSVGPNPRPNNMATSLNVDAKLNGQSQEPIYAELVVPANAPDPSATAPQMVTQYNNLASGRVPLPPASGPPVIPNAAASLKKPASCSNNLLNQRLPQTATKPQTIQAPPTPQSRASICLNAPTPASQAIAPIGKSTATTTAGSLSANQYHTPGSFLKEQNAPTSHIISGIKKSSKVQVCKISWRYIVSISTWT